jgi:hypothetical protein
MKYMKNFSEKSILFYLNVLISGHLGEFPGFSDKKPNRRRNRLAGFAPRRRDPAFLTVIVPRIRLKLKRKEILKFFKISFYIR